MFDGCFCVPFVYLFSRCLSSVMHNANILVQPRKESLHSMAQQCPVKELKREKERGRERHANDFKCKLRLKLLRQIKNEGVPSTWETFVCILLHFFCLIRKMQ